MNAEPLVIVGSRLQAITASAIALAIAVALVPDQMVWVLACLVLWGFALTRMLMRLTLHHDRAEWRTWRGSVTAPRQDLVTDMGHRYIQLASAEGKLKIEVPVEIRPNVRIWVDGQDSSGPTEPPTTEPPSTTNT